jgi:hypothetical protein
VRRLVSPWQNNLSRAGVDNGHDICEMHMLMLFGAPCLKLHQASIECIVRG